MIERKKCLIFVRYYLPGFQSGGPVRSVSNLVEAIGDQFDFYIVTSNRDFLKAEPYDCVEAGWNVVGQAKVLYLDQGRLGLGLVRRLIAEVKPAVIYLNSFFDPRFSFPILALKFLAGDSAPPVVCAPRGELAAGAMERKGLRKQIYIFAFRFLGLPCKVALHATSDQEARDLREKLSDKSKIFLAANLISRGFVSDRSMPLGRHEKDSAFRIVFLSRIHPKKNLDFAIDCLHGVTGNIEFNIFGPVDDEAYWSSCLRKAEQLPSNIKLRFHGPIAHSEVQATLQKNNLFFFPTKNENFGHVVIEALQAGLPVVTSDRTPWNAIGSMKIGACLPLVNTKSFSDRINEISKWTDEDWRGFQSRLDKFLLLLAQNSNSEDDHVAMFTAAT